MTHVGLFSLARGASHLIEGQLHLLDCAYCFNEGLADPADVNWRTFLWRGMYGPDSVQDKRGAHLTHLVYNLNNIPAYLGHHRWSMTESQVFRRRWILSLRNPMRILLSRENTGKKKWRLDDDKVAQFFTWFNIARQAFRTLMQWRPDDTFIISVEKYAAAPTKEFGRIAGAIGVAQPWISSRRVPEQFFRVMGRTGEQPVVRDGYLASPTRDVRIQGWGGSFNPLAAVSPERLYAHDLARDVRPETLAIARNYLGAQALEFYLTDVQHRYEGIQDHELLDL
jgi:hypothetical protein